MSFKLFYENSAKALFHGTSIYNYKNIKEKGLQPKLGPFVSNAYDDTGYTLEPLVFAADKNGFGKAMNAMRFAIAHDINKRHLTEVTLEDVKKYGLMLKLKDDTSWEHRPSSKDDPDYKWQQENPNASSSIEPGDHYNSEDVAPQVFYTGNKLIDLIRKMGFIHDFVSDFSGKADKKASNILYGQAFAKLKNMGIDEKEIDLTLDGRTDKELKKIILTPDDELDLMMETPIFDDSNKRMGNNEMGNSRLKDSAIFTKKLSDKLTLSIFQDGSRCGAVVYDEFQDVAKLQCFDDKKFPFPKVETVIVFKDYQGQGIGREMYSSFIEQVGGIISGRELTGKSGYGSIDIWESLSKKYFTYIVDRDDMTVKQVDRIDRKNMGKSYKLFMATKEPFKQEKITEVKIDNSNSDMGDHYADKNPDNNEEEFFRKHYKLIGKNPIKDCEMHSYLDGNAMFIFLVDENKKPVARYDMYIINYSNLGKMLTEHTTVVDKTQQGKGYTSVVYSYLINKYGALVSDANHTDGMKNTWQKLATKFKPSHIEEFSDKRGQPVWKETELSRIPDTVYDADRDLLLLLRK